MAQNTTAHQQEPSAQDFWRWVGRSIRPIAGWVLVALGGIFMLVGWLGVSREVLVAKQLPFLVSGGIGGLALVVVGAKLISARDLQKYEDRLEHLEGLVDQLHTILLTEADRPAEPETAAAGDPAAPGSQPNGVHRVSALPNGTSFHRPDCSMVAGKPGVIWVAAAEATSEGLHPCRVCQPLDAGSELAPS